MVNSRLLSRLPRDRAPKPTADAVLPFPPFTCHACVHICVVFLGKHVVFGRVIRGYEVAERIAEVSTDEKDRPRVPVVISNSGELMLRAQAQTEAQQGKKAAGEFCLASLTGLIKLVPANRPVTHLYSRVRVRTKRQGIGGRGAAPQEETPP